MKDSIKRLLETAVNYIVRLLAIILLRPQKGQLPSDKIKRILVYGQMGIGNIILFTPFLKALRRYFPHSEIKVLFLNRNGAEQVLEGSDLADEIVVWDYRHLTYRQRLKEIWKLKNWKPDLIVSRFASYPVDIALVTLLSRAPYRVGHVSSGGWQGRYDYLHNYPVKMAENEHDLDRYLHLASDVGIPTVDRRPSFYISTDDEKAAGAFLRLHGIGEGEPFVTIQPGTSQAQSWKRWGAEKWASLSGGLLRDNIKIVAVGSPDEKDMIERIYDTPAARPIIAAGELTLKQTAALIKRSLLLVCNDSGLMHVAVAVDTPVVAIYGPGDPARTAPRDKRHVVIRKELPCSPCVSMGGTARVEACQNRICLDTIKVEEVVRAVEGKLKYVIDRTVGAS
jgi:lipopolysaccharide heptosyltransferase II